MARKHDRSRRSHSQTVASVENPKSGRWIAVGGPAYRDLLKLGYTDKELKRGGVKRRPKTNRRYSSTAGRSQPSQEQLKMRVSRDTLYKGRGSRTRGWGQAAPRRGKPRHRMMKECGEKCFMMPEKEGFPVCAKLSNSADDCQLDCRGVQAAFQRARQYGYSNVAKSAKKLYDAKCSK